MGSGSRPCNSHVESTVSAASPPLLNRASYPYCMYSTTYSRRNLSQKKLLAIANPLSVGESNPAFARPSDMTGACTNRYTNRDLLRLLYVVISILSSLPAEPMLSPSTRPHPQPEWARILMRVPLRPLSLPRSTAACSALVCPPRRFPPISTCLQRPPSYQTVRTMSINTHPSLSPVSTYSE